MAVSFVSGSLDPGKILNRSSHKQHIEPDWDVLAILRNNSANPQGLKSSLAVDTREARLKIASQIEHLAMTPGQASLALDISISLLKAGVQLPNKTLRSVCKFTKSDRWASDTVHSIATEILKRLRENKRPDFDKMSLPEVALD